MASYDAAMASVQCHVGCLRVPIELAANGPFPDREPSPAVPVQHGLAQKAVRLKQTNRRIRIFAVWNR